MVPEITGYKDKHEHIDLNGVRSVVYLMDCNEFMQQIPSVFFQLSCVDPPYGIGEDGKKNHSREGVAKPTLYADKNWDNSTPEKQYFDELIRVSKNQIIWGANHFISKIPYNSSCWLVWDKDNTGDFADCELAWTSFNTAVRKFTWRWNGMLQQNMKQKEERIHPTQKPVALYSWIFEKYAKAGMKILDTHLGSQSSRIAAHKAGLDFWGTELDKDYFGQGNKRFDRYLGLDGMFSQEHFE